MTTIAVTMLILAGIVNAMLLWSIQRQQRAAKVSVVLPPHRPQKRLCVIW
jgi:hypothetical protein